MGRAPCCDKTKVKRGPWSPEEDIILRSYLLKHGTVGNWIALPAKAGLKRCGKSCRLRWLNYLRPDIKHGGFTEEEDNIICTLYNSIGSRWSVIASQLPGRTDNDIKNYWNTKLKKKLSLLADQGSNININIVSSSTSSNLSSINPKVDLVNTTTLPCMINDHIMSYQQKDNPNGIVLNPNYDQCPLPLPDSIEASSSLSISSNNYSNIQDEDDILLDFGFEYSTYLDLLNGFGLHDM
ncbi:hypothetical protein ACFE04_012063 [Oxalis oulophora]